MSRARTVANFGDGIATADIGDGQITTAKIASDAITDALLPAGSVLQVVAANTSTEVTTTSNSYSDTGLTANITPSSTSSKILVSASVCIDINESDLCDLKLLRDSTDILETGYNGYHSGTNNYLVAHCKLELLDSPNTTNQVTYKVQFKRGQGDNNLIVNYDDGNGDSRSFITLMEIAG